jgi:hypothetical protein
MLSIFRARMLTRRRGQMRIVYFRAFTMADVIIAQFGNPINLLESAAMHGTCYAHRWLFPLHWYSTIPASCGFEAIFGWLRIVDSHPVLDFWLEWSSLSSDPGPGLIVTCFVIRASMIVFVSDSFKVIFDWLVVRCVDWWPRIRQFSVEVVCATLRLSGAEEGEQRQLHALWQWNGHLPRVGGSLRE